MTYGSKTLVDLLQYFATHIEIFLQRPLASVTISWKTLHEADSSAHSFILTGVFWLF